MDIKLTLNGVELTADNIGDHSKQVLTSVLANVAPLKTGDVIQIEVMETITITKFSDILNWLNLIEKDTSIAAKEYLYDPEDTTCPAVISNFCIRMKEVRTYSNLTFLDYLSKLAYYGFNSEVFNYDDNLEQPQTGYYIFTRKGVLQIL